MSVHVIGPDCAGCRAKTDMAHPYMRDWFWNDIKPNYPNAHISWAFRTQIEQEECVKNGTSKAHYPHSGHNHTENGKPCSLALDLFELISGIAQFRPDFYNSIHQSILRENKPILWGAIWTKLGDSNHFELKSASIPGPACSE